MSKTKGDPKKGGKRKTAAVAWTLILLALIGLAGYYMLQVRQVIVEGNVTYTDAEVQKLAAIPENTHMLQVDERLIKKNVEADPYLSLTKVEYKLPDTVALTVYERRPAARIAAGGAFVLVDRQLTVLSDKPAGSAEYPQIEGIAVRTIEPGRQVLTEERVKLAAATAILDELSARNALGTVLRIDLTDTNSIRFETKNGPLVLFGQPGSEPEKIAWMVRLLPELISQGKTDGVLDISAGNTATYGANHIPDRFTPSPSPGAAAWAGAAVPKPSPDMPEGGQGVSGTAAIQ